MHFATNLNADKLCWLRRGLKRVLEEANLDWSTGRAAAGSQPSSPAVHKQLPAQSATTAPADPTPDTENQQPASSQVHQRQCHTQLQICPLSYVELN